MKIIPIKQKDSVACGPTCIFIVAKALGVTVRLNKIEKLSDYKKKGGLSNTDLLSTLTKLGFSYKEKNNSTWEELILATKSRNSVAIISWMLDGYIGHFSVVQKMTKTHVFLADSNKGKIIKMEKIKFMRLWMDYDDMWYPEKNTNIQLRWFVSITK